MLYVDKVLIAYHGLCYIFQIVYGRRYPARVEWVPAYFYSWHAGEVEFKQNIYFDLTCW